MRSRACASSTRARAASGTSGTAAWRHLPEAIVLEVCRYLDAAGLARLETARGLGDGDTAKRAWRAAAKGMSRGGLSMLPAKAFAAANARATALYPISYGLNRHVTFTLDQSSASLDEFVFSVGIFWRDQTGADCRATFDYMEGHVSRTFVMYSPSTFCFLCPDDAAGHNAITPLLLAAEREVNVAEVSLLAQMNAIRIRDGAAARIGRFEGSASDTGQVDLDDSGEKCSGLEFDEGTLEIFGTQYAAITQHAANCPAMTLHMHYNERTGKPVSFHSTPWSPSGNDVSEAEFAAHLHQMLDIVGS